MGRDPHPDRDAAKVAWEAAFGAPPPAYVSVRVMEHAVAYEQQRKASGGLDRATQRALSAAVRDRGKARAPRVNPGGVFIREWHGRTYRVEVTASGYVYNGQTHRSLSAIARLITGAAWSGPRFFGLQAKRGAK